MSGFWERILGPSVVKETEKDETKKSLVLPEDNLNDGAMVINSNLGGASSFSQYGATFDYQIPEDEVQLITKYRDLADQPEIEKAINHIINESFSYDDESMPVDINLKDVKLSDGTKKKIKEEFEYILNLMNFRVDSYDIFKKWYVDGRLYYQKVYDDANIKKGIIQLKYIDPRKIRKVRKEIVANGNNKRNEVAALRRDFEEFYIFNPDGINNSNPQGYKISKDSITYIHSGVFSKENKTVLSNLHKSIRYFNVLRSIEDSVVIYRLTRASEKRVFNIEVGDLPTQSAEQQMKKVIDKFRKKLSFNAQTGEVIEQKRHMAMIEDFWFAKRDGKGTTVDVLQGGQSLGELDDIEYFKKKLYESLNVPITRLDPTMGFSLGRSTEISREELAFAKFISRLRKRFSGVFDDLLKTQLIAKNIIKEKDWKEISKNVSYDFKEDNFFSELKWSEIHQNRFNALRDAGDLLGHFYSKKWIKENILMMSEDEMKQEEKQIAKERAEDAKNGVDSFGAIQGAQDDDPSPPQPVAPPAKQNFSDPDQEE